MEFFPVEHAFVRQHLHEAVESPIIEDSSIEIFVALLVLLCDHLPLRKITDHNGSLNRFVRDEMGCFVQTVLLFITLVLRHAFVDLTQVLIAARSLLTAIPFATKPI